MKKYIVLYIIVYNHYDITKVEVFKMEEWKKSLTEIKSLDALVYDEPVHVSHVLKMVTEGPYLVGLCNDIVFIKVDGKVCYTTKEKLISYLEESINTLKDGE